MYGPRIVKLIDGATISKATVWQLTAADVAIDTQTITIGGVVFTTVNPIGTTAGNVLLGANKEATLANLATLINDPVTSTATGVKLSANDAYIIKSLLGLSASVTGAVLTLTSTKADKTIVVSDTETNLSWSSYYVSDPIAFGADFGKTSLQVVASAITSGNGVFTAQVSNDGSNWVDYNRLTSNATNTNGQTDTRVASLTLSANGSAVASIPDSFGFLRVKCVPTTDGTYSAIVMVA